MNYPTIEKVLVNYEIWEDYGKKKRIKFYYVFIIDDEACSPVFWTFALVLNEENRTDIFNSFTNSFFFYHNSEKEYGFEEDYYCEDLISDLVYIFSNLPKDIYKGYICRKNRIIGDLIYDKFTGKFNLEVDINEMWED